MTANIVLICCIIFLFVRIADLQRQINKMTKDELGDSVYIRFSKN